MLNAEGNLIGSFHAWDLPTPAGGFCTGLDISADGTRMIHWTDSWQGFIRDAGEPRWRQMFRTDTVAPADQTPGDDPGVQTDQSGGFAGRIAPSNKDIIYQAWYFLWKSIDGGASWQRTGLPGKEMNSNEQTDGIRRHSRALDVHPTDPDTLIVGTNNDGVYYSTDGGDNFTTITGLGTVTGPYKFLVAFDPGNPNYVYTHAWGHGLYRSTTGVSGAFTLMPGSPTVASCLVVSPAGRIFVVSYHSGTNRLHRCDRGSTTWTNVAGSSTCDAVAIDPFDEDHWVVTEENGGFIAQTYDAGATWKFANRNPVPPLYELEWVRGDGEVDWFSNRSSKPMYPAQPLFDPVVPNKLWITEGIGVCWTILPAEGVEMTNENPLVVHDYSYGNQQLIPMEFTSSPGNPLIAHFWDKPHWPITDRHAKSVMWSYPVNEDGFGEGTVTVGYAADYASDDPDFLVSVVGQGSNRSGYSEDGGRTWHQFLNIPAGIGGWVACSTRNNFIYTWSNNGPAYYTLDGGATFNLVNFGGYSPVTHWCGAYYISRQNITADKEVPGTFYALMHNMIRDFTATIDIPTSTLTHVDHGYVANNRIRLTTTGALPTGLSTGVDYFVRNPTADTFQLATTSGGTPITLSGSQSGIHTVVPQADYLGRDIAGVWKTTDGGVNWTQQFEGCIQRVFGHPSGSGSQAWQARFQCVPGYANEIVYADCEGNNANNDLLWSVDGGVTWTPFSYVKNVRSWSFGKAAPGQSRPAIYATCTVGGVTGLYASFDWLATSPQLIAQDPDNWIGTPSPVGGDLNIFGAVAFGRRGNGAGQLGYAKRFGVAISDPPGTPGDVNAEPAGWDILPLYGDSNSNGMVVDYPGADPDDTRYERKPGMTDLAGVYTFTGPDAAIVSLPVATIRSDITPMYGNNNGTAADTAKDRVGIGEFLGRYWKALHPNRNVLVVPMGRGGASLLNAGSPSDLAYGSNTLYTPMIQQMQAAVAACRALSDSVRVPFLTFCGPSNDATHAANTTAAETTALTNIVNGMRTDIPESTDVPFVFMGLHPLIDADNSVRNALTAVAAALPKVGVVVPGDDAADDDLHPVPTKLDIAGDAMIDWVATQTLSDKVSAFSIPSQSGVAVDTDIISDPVQMPLLRSGELGTITVTGGEVSLNDGGFTSADQDAAWIDTFEVKVHSSASEGTTAYATVRVTSSTGHFQEATFAATTLSTSGTTAFLPSARVRGGLTLINGKMIGGTGRFSKEEI